MADRFSRGLTARARQSAIQDWLGPRAYRILSQRNDIDQSPWTAIVMSHRNRHPELAAEWRFAIEKALQYCRSSHSFLLASDSTPLGPFLLQAAKRLQIPTIRLCIPRSNESLIEWEQRVESVCNGIVHSDVSESRLWVSPIDDQFALQVTNDTTTSNRPFPTHFETVPLVDRALIAIADRVRVISVAPGSKTERLLRLRLDDARFPTASIFVAMDSMNNIRSAATLKASKRQHPAKLSTTTQENLLDRGAVGWIHLSRVGESTMDSCNLEREHKSRPSSTGIASTYITRVPSFKFTMQTHRWSESWPYLSHCTRARTGAWPDQSQVGYYDSLIASKHDDTVNATAFDTLKRILSQQRLVASSDLNRSGQATVSLTEVPLQALLPRRQFQSHLGRWDWESYGICIHRRWIEANGGRRVLYSSCTDWRSLSPQDRPFYQPSSDIENPDRTEWEREKEWRVIGDIHLADVPFELAFAFVPSQREAFQLTPICRFPIMVV